MAQNDERQFALVTKRLETLLKRDVENQAGQPAAAEKLAAFQRDPQTWVAENFNPLRSEAKVTNLPAHETRAAIDWSQWKPKQD
jgi:hypothetical protein